MTIVQVADDIETSTMSTEVPAPPEVKRIDIRIADLEHQASELAIRRRLTVAGVSVGLLVEAGLITLAVFFSDAIGAAIYGGLLIMIGIVVLVGLNIDARNERLALLRDVARHEAKRRNVLAGRWDREAEPLARYKEHLPLLVDAYRALASRYRRQFTAFQTVVIVGSLSASAATAALGASREGRAGAIGLSLIVGISASLSLTFRPRERATALQKVADDVEREGRAAELQIGTYADLQSDRERLTLLATRVEDLRSAQATKDRDLDLPPDLQAAASNDLTMP